MTISLNFRVKGIIMKKLIFILSLCIFSFVSANESSGSTATKDWLKIVDAGNCGSAPISCNSLHNLSVTVDKTITDTESATVTVSFMQYANFHTGGAFLLFKPQVTFELDGQFVDQMQMTDIDPLVEPYVYNYYGNNYLLALIKYEYQFEWDLRDSNDLPQQLFASLGVKVNAGAKNLATATTMVIGFENDLGPQNCELGVGSQCNMLNGNLYYQQTDYAHQGTHLKFQRHYNSLQEVTSAVTKNDWSSTGGARVIDFSFLLATGKKLYLYLDEQGQYEYFHEQDDGSFKADDDVALQFIATASGFEISQPDGQQWLHDTSGKLVSMTDVRGNITQYLYENNKLSEMKGVYGHSLTFTYDAQGKLTTIKTPDNQAITYQYDIDGLLADVIWPDGRKESYRYNTSGDLIIVTRNDTDIVQQNTYDTHGRVLTHDDQKANNQFTLSYQSLIKSGVTLPTKLSDYELSTDATDDKGNNWIVKSGYSNGEQLMTDYQHQSGLDTYSKNYDSNGNLATMTDPQGNITGYTYNQDDQFLSMKRGEGTAEEQIINYEYINNDIDLLTKISRKSTSSVFSNQLHDIEIAYNPQYQVQQVTEKGHAKNGDALLRTSQISYDTSGRILSIDGFSDGSNDITQLTYHLCNTGDECGQIATVTNAVGDQTQFTDYDAAGRVTKMIQPNSTVVDTTYNTSGNVLSTALTSNSITRTTTYQYDQNRLTDIILPNGEAYSFSYDGDQKINQIMDSAGNAKIFHYDSRDNLIREELLDNSAALHYEISRTFDRLDQINSVTTINGVTAYNTNNIGQLKQTTDAFVENDLYEYDSLSRLLKHTDALINDTSYTYNNHDKLLSVTDAEGSLTTYDYDDFGRVTRQESPASGISSYQYDNADNMITSTDARNIQTQYQYDNANRITQITYPNAENDISFTYNNMGLPNTATYGSDQSQYVYNGFNELTQKTDIINGQNFTINYEYNLNGKVSQLTYPSGRAIDYTFNSIGLIETITTTYDGITQTLASNINYLPFGGITDLIYGNGKKLTQTFNKNYQITNKAIDNVLDKAYVYDAVNNIETINDNLNTLDSEYFTYSSVDRLIEAMGNYGDLSFGYDAIGNRLSKTEDDGITNNTTHYVYQNNSQLTELNGTANTLMTYDERGNLLSKGNDTFTYNSDARLSSATVNAVTTHYSYNDRGQRITKIFDNGEFRYYVYDLQGLLIAELNNEAETQVEYVYLNGQRIALLSTYLNISTPAINEQYYVINQDTGLKLKASSTQEKSLMVMADATDESDSVKFTKVASTNNYFYFKNVETGFHFRPLSKKNNSNIEQRPSKFIGSRTQWKTKPAGGNSVYISNRWSKDYLRAPIANVGSNAITHKKKTDLSAQWLLTPVTEIAVSSTQVYYVHTTHLDVPLALTDDQGDIAWQASYTPFGKISITLDTLPERFTARFPGQYSDTETGLYYNYFRDYDPELGRYIQSDPIGLAGGINTYGYVSGNPISFIDPLGLLQFGTRPLSGTNFSLPMGNLGLLHENAFFSDGRNVGFFAEGIRPDDPNQIPNYTLAGPFYDDTLMMIALGNLKNSMKWLPDNANENWWDNSDPYDYDLTLRNCQDFSDALRDEYSKLGGKSCPVAFAGASCPVTP
jgi:RHS repeat-associated protein